MFVFLFFFFISKWQIVLLSSISWRSSGFLTNWMQEREELRKWTPTSYPEGFGHTHHHLPPSLSLSLSLSQHTHTHTNWLLNSIQTKPSHPTLSPDHFHIYTPGQNIFFKQNQIKAWFVIMSKNQSVKKNTSNNYKNKYKK